MIQRTSETGYERMGARDTLHKQAWGQTPRFAEKCVDEFVGQGEADPHCLKGSVSDKHTRVPTLVTRRVMPSSDRFASRDAQESSRPRTRRRSMPERLQWF